MTFISTVACAALDRLFLFVSKWGVCEAELLSLVVVVFYKRKSAS